MSVIGSQNLYVKIETNLHGIYKKGIKMEYIKQKIVKKCKSS